MVSAYRRAVEDASPYKVNLAVAVAVAPSVRELAIADFRQLPEGEILFSSC